MISNNKDCRSAVVRCACDRRRPYIIALVCAVSLLVLSPRIVLRAAWVAGVAKTSLLLSYEVGTPAYIWLHVARSEVCRHSADLAHLEATKHIRTHVYCQAATLQTCCRVQHTLGSRTSSPAHKSLVPSRQIMCLSEAAGRILCGNYASVQHNTAGYEILEENIFPIEAISPLHYGNTCTRPGPLTSVPGQGHVMSDEILKPSSNH